MVTTIYGWDASHYDGTLTATTLDSAKTEGIEFFTHKLGEALGGIDATQATALSAARAAGIQVIGGYWFLHNDADPAAEARKCVATADQYEPWWREFDGWFWQADAERSTSLPSKAHVKTFCDTLAAETDRVVIVYGSHGQYGNGLTGIGHPLWNANYPSREQRGFAVAYPGDGYAGWAPYSGQTPVIAQYSSSATIAGHTTCDANAFRGSVDDLLTLIGATMPITDADAAKIALAVWNLDQIPNPAARPDSTAHKPAGNNATTQADFALGDMWNTTYNALGAIQALASPATVAAAVVAALPKGSGVPLTETDVEAAVHQALSTLILTAAPATK